MNKSLLLAGIALLLLPGSPASAQVGSIALALTGTLASGSKIVATGTDRLEARQVYQLAITGSCHGTGIYAAALPPGTPLSAFVSGLDSTQALTPLLSATVLNAAGKFPFTPVNLTVSGTFASGVDTIAGTLRLKVSVNKLGRLSAQLGAIALGRKGKGRAPIPDKTDKVIIDGASVQLASTPFGGHASVDMSFSTPHGMLGAGVTGTDGTGETLPVTIAPNHTATIVVVAQNTGGSVDTLTLQVAPAAGGFSERIYVGKTDETVAAMNGKLVVPISGLSIQPGAAQILTWRVSNVNAPPGGVTRLVLTGMPTVNPAVEDAIVLSLTGG